MFYREYQVPVLAPYYIAIVNGDILNSQAKIGIISEKSKKKVEIFLCETLVLVHRNTGTGTCFTQ